MKQNLSLRGDFRALNFRGWPRSRMLINEDINAPSSLEPDSNSWIPKLLAIQITKNLPWSGAGSLIFRSQFDRACSRFLLQFSRNEIKHPSHSLVEWWTHHRTAWQGSVRSFCSEICPTANQTWRSSYCSSLSPASFFSQSWLKQKYELRNHRP